jgi:hypothetical protein
MEPNRILVGGSARIRRDAPARLDHAVIDKRKDQIRIADINRKDHGRALAASTAVHNLRQWT